MDDPHDPLTTAVIAALAHGCAGGIAGTAGPRPADLTVRLARAEALPTAARLLAHDFGFGLATLVVTDDLASNGSLTVRYLFDPTRPPADGTRRLPDVFVTLELAVDPARPTLPSLTPLLAAANWHEREAQDLFGLVFTGHPDPRTLVNHDGWPAGRFPLRKAFAAATRPPREPAAEFPHLLAEGEGVFEIPVGPIHAGIIEPGHFRFSSIGEIVLNLDARLFYTHRGLEKRVEGLALAEACFVAERICGACAFAHGLGFCEAAEQIAGIAAPPRARAIRTVGLELERLYNHAGDLGNLCAGASFHYGTSAGGRIKEALQQLNEAVAGNRWLRGLLAPGGVRLDLAPPLVALIRAALDRAQADIADLKQTIDANPTVIDRLDETGRLPRQAALDLGTTGVAARASGVDRDSRRDHPVAGYRDLGDAGVAVCLAEAGDIYARLAVRAAEAQESIRLVRAQLDALPDGRLCAPLPDRLPPWGVGLCAIESPRGAAIHWLRVDDAGRVDRYHLRSPSFANWPAVALAAEDAIVPDFPLVNKSFELCYSCTDR